MRSYLVEMEEGIFRKSGLLDDINALKQRVDLNSAVPTDLLDSGSLSLFLSLHHSISKHRTIHS